MQTNGEIIPWEQARWQRVNDEKEFYPITAYAWRKTTAGEWWYQLDGCPHRTRSTHLLPRATQLAKQHMKVCRG